GIECRHCHSEWATERLADHGRLWGAAGDGREGEALALEGANVDLTAPWLTPLVRGGDAAPGRPAADGRAAGEQGIGQRRPTVVAYPCQQWVDGGLVGADLVALAPVADPGHPRPVADQIVAAAGDSAADVAPRVLAGDNCVGQRPPEAGGDEQAAALLSG